MRREHMTMKLLYFNSTLVRLKVRLNSLWLLLLPNFNSTLVRLKALWQNRNRVVNTFQFHFGTIKRQWCAVGSRSRYWFQFHFGTIKRPIILADIPLQPDFNSTLVRLKDSASPDAAAETKFQFHFGTIKRLIHKLGCYQS